MEHVERVIIVVRRHKVLLDVDLAELYGVSVRALNQAVRRNAERFPIDFMFQLTLGEAQRSRSQTVILNGHLPETKRQSGRRDGPCHSSRPPAPCTSTACRALGVPKVAVSEVDDTMRELEAVDTLAARPVA
jgi:hypothetical protein